MPSDHASSIRCGDNLLWASLCAADRSRLERHADEIGVARGQAVLGFGEPVEAVLFPVAGLFSLRVNAGDRSAEIGVVGREGILGWPALLGAERSPHCAIARMGDATLLRIGIERLRAACGESPTLAAALLRFVHVFGVQTSDTIAAHLHHGLGPRVARWLLMRHDRVTGDILPVHHEEIADSLNVRRASITDQLHLLEGLAFIRATRGRIIVRDRQRLELFAADAYGLAEASYRALIAPFGKSPAGQAAPIRPPAGDASRAAGGLRHHQPSLASA